jgi:hypothetical protein
MISRRVILLTLASTVAGVLPGAAPLVPVTRAVLHVPPAVRLIVRRLHRVDLPERWRRRNWIGRRGEGSCVHASLLHLLHWQGRHRLADWWRARHADGETADGLAAKLEAAGIRFAETRSADVSFLEWAIRTRRGAAVVVQQGAHMVNLVGLDRRFAHILDSNAPDRVTTVPRALFLSEWKSSGGWGVTPVGSPLPPDPWVVQASGGRQPPDSGARRRVLKRHRLRTISGGCHA